MNHSLKLNHPLVRDQFVLETPQIQRLFEKLKQWIWVGLTGAAVYGVSRCGKTKGVEFCLPRLLTRTGAPIRYFYSSPHKGVANTDQKLWSHLLVSMGHGITPSRTAIQNYETLLSELGDASLVNPERIVVYCMDEAQNLTTFHYELLTCLHNELRHRGVRLFVLLVGPMELRMKLRRLSSPEYAHIRSRFYAAIYRFRGCTTKEEIATILGLFDDAGAWEGVEAPSKLFLKGTHYDATQIADLTDDFWYVYQTQILVTEYEEWPIAYFMATVRALLMDYLPYANEKTDILSAVAGAALVSGIHVEEDE